MRDSRVDGVISSSPDFDQFAFAGHAQVAFMFFFSRVQDGEGSLRKKNSKSVRQPVTPPVSTDDPGRSPRRKCLVEPVHGLGPDVKADDEGAWSGYLRRSFPYSTSSRDPYGTYYLGFILKWERGRKRSELNQTFNQL